jgi:hypothetical protein
MDSEKWNKRYVHMTKHAISHNFPRCQRNYERPYEEL